MIRTRDLVLVGRTQTLATQKSSVAARFNESLFSLIIEKLMIIEVIDENVTLLKSFFVKARSLYSRNIFNVKSDCAAVCFFSKSVTDLAINAFFYSISQSTTWSQKIRRIIRRISGVPRRKIIRRKFRRINHFILKSSNFPFPKRLFWSSLARCLAPRLFEVFYSHSKS